MAMKKLFLAILLVIFAQNSYAFETKWQEASDQNKAAKLRVIGSYYSSNDAGEKLILGTLFW